MGLRTKAGFALLVGLQLLFSAQLVVHVPGAFGEQVIEWASTAIFAGAVLACVARARAVPAERAAWLSFAAGLAMFGLGDVYYTVFQENLAEVPFPSPADAFYLGVYPCFYLGVLRLFRARVGRSLSRLWLDGVIAALAVGAVAAAIVFDAVLDHTGGPAATVATNLAYPAGDLLLLAFVAALMVIAGGRMGRTLAWIAGGLCLFGAADSVYLYQTAVGSYDVGGILDAGWPAAAVLIAIAAWRPVGRASQGERADGLVITGPALSGALALALLVYDHFDQTNLLALVLASLCVLAVLARVALTLADKQREISARREVEALLRRNAIAQATVADLGHQALGDPDLGALMDTTVLVVRDTLGADAVAVCELLDGGESLVVRAGAGFPEGHVGHMIIGTKDSAAGEALRPRA